MITLQARRPENRLSIPRLAGHVSLSSVKTGSGLKHHPIQWLPRTLSGSVKWPERDANQLPPSSDGD
jgi:hypothetical protein